MKYGFGSIGFFRAFITHMRPYLLYVSGVAGAAGLAFSTPDGHQLSNFFSFLCFFLGYGFGQALTDCFQIDTDSISAPYRPLVRGTVTPKAVGIFALTGLLGILLWLAYLNPLNILFGGLSVLGLATYTYFKRNFWFSGPFYNGWIVMLLPVMGYITHRPVEDLLGNPRFLCLLGLTLFSYANFVLMGYLKDITADRETGYKTFPVVWGWNASTIVGDFFAFASIILSFSILDRSNFWAWGFFWAASAIAVAGQSFAHFTKNKTEQNSGFPIAATVRSFILWHLSTILSARPDWVVLCFLFYGLFELTLYFRPEKHQI